MAARRILLVDDESFLTEILKFQFSRRGAEILVADDGATGLELAISEIPDLVVTDFQMPTMNGLEMCTALRETPETAAIPAIMLTGRGHLVTEEQLAKTNIRSLMSKPFSATQLIAKVEEILGRLSDAENKAA